MIRRILGVSFTALALVALPLVSRAADAAKTTKGAEPLHISMGEKVEIKDYIVPGKTTIFDFYSTFCPPCMRIKPAMEKLHHDRPDIAVVEVDINRPGHQGIDFKSPVGLQYQLESIPHFVIYGPDGQLVVEDKGQEMAAYDAVLKLVNKN